MNSIDVLTDALARSTEVCHQALEGLDAAVANRIPVPVTNSTSWLVWHIARQHAGQVAYLRGYFASIG